MWMHLLVHLFQSTLLQEERPQDNMVMQIGKMISIHAPTRGATCQPYTPSHSCLISIHAPTRGATIIVYFFGVKLIDFNPRSYKRSDCICSAPVQNVYYFNPRSYKRSDVRFRLQVPLPGYFNPRSYKRSDGKNAQLSLYLSVIIIA